MPNRRGVFFLNARAGTFSAAEEADVRAAAEANGLDVVEIGPGVDSRSIVRDYLSRGLRAFVVAGGDGSIHHIAQALVHTDGVLGIVPVGSLNHLARDLKLPVGNWREALEVAVRGEIRQIDAGRVNDHYFFNSAMLGITPTISEYRERFRSVHNRWRAYLKATRIALHHFPHVNLVVELDGRLETFHTQLFVVAVNAYDLTQVGIISTKTSLEDGKLSIYSLSFMSRLQFIRAAAKYLRGRIADVPGFRSIRTRQLRVDSGRRHLRVALDGELHDYATPVQIAAVPAALLVRVGGG